MSGYQLFKKIFVPLFTLGLLVLSVIYGLIPAWQMFWASL